MHTPESNDYAFGQAWADSLIESFENDPFARQVMTNLHLTTDDLRRYYLRQPYFARVRAKFDEQPDDLANNDPVVRVLLATRAVKDETLAQFSRGRWLQ